MREGDQVTKPTPYTRTVRDRRAAFSEVGGARGCRNQTDSITRAAQDVVSEEAVMLVGDRAGLIAEAEVGWRSNRN